MDASKRYLRAVHAMQAGVSTLISFKECRSIEPKHLRVGINSALVESSALAKLLIDKGVITMDEYENAMADAMEKEVRRYEEIIKKLTGKEIKLL